MARTRTTERQIIPFPGQRKARRLLGALPYRGDRMIVAISVEGDPRITMEDGRTGRVIAFDLTPLLSVFETDVTSVSQVLS